MTTQDELLDGTEAAKFCRVSLRTLKRQHDLPSVKLTARRVVYRKSDLIAWIDAKAAASRRAA